MKILTVPGCLSQTDQVRHRGFVLRLTDLIGPRFSIWVPAESSWRCVYGEFGDLSELSGVELAMAGGDWSTRALPDPWTQQVGSQVCLIVPLVQAGENVLVVEPVPNAGDDRAVSRGRLLQQVVAQDHELEQMSLESHSLAVQVSRNLEELSFLREMAESFKLTSQQDWQGSIDDVLGALARVIRAEGVAWIETENVRSFHRGQRGDESRTHVRWSGPGLWDDETTVRFVQRLGRRVSGTALVKNGFDRDPRSQTFPGVANFVLVEVAVSEPRRAWLFAANRIRDPFLSADYEPIPAEFGSVEASLLTSTATMLATYSSNVDLLAEKEGLLVNVVRALVAAIEAKDQYTCGHSERVARYARRLAEHLGLGTNACENIYLSGLLHDIGKIGVSDAILKKEGKLTPEEFEEIKQHPEAGWAILCDLAELQGIVPGVLHHHERYDGKGYPDGLAREHVPMQGRILAVADAYDAMTSDRPYRPGMDHERAVQILREGAGCEWDPEVVAAFLDVLGEIQTIRRNYRKQPPRRRQPTNDEPSA